MNLTQAHGFWWPADGAEKEPPTKYKKNYIDRVHDADAAIKRARGRLVAVQAGGHCGVWPKYLAGQFGAVYTFEPDVTNFACLARNVALPNVFAARAMLGNDRGPKALEVHRKWIGAHHGNPGHPGSVPLCRVDDLELPACDLIILDVEGMELPALRGAQDTIARFRPVIMVEDRGHGATYGFGSHADLVGFLAGFGYAERERVQYDVVFTVEDKA